ncbi:retinol dehydrogenase 12 [Mytilus galloprovincialis]|nr:retinol dehydrogenase 12 [Mytilus galloprovincialis]
MEYTDVVQNFVLDHKIGLSVAVSVGVVLWGIRRYVKGPRYYGKRRIDGIGKETAIDLVKRGAKVIIACRDMTRGNNAVDDIKRLSGSTNVSVVQLDLASLKSVRKFAEEIHKTEKRLDILINNAGVMACPYMKTEDGLEMQFGVNHIGHFLLTNLLLDLIKKAAPSRIVNVSSLAHVFTGQLNFDDIAKREKYYNAEEAYTQSKLCNILFTKELASRLSGTGVTTYSLHPVDESLDKETGKYYSDCAEKAPSKPALDEGAAKKLWELSEKLVVLKRLVTTMLRDVYTDDIIITEENSIDLLKAAHKYEFEGLLSKCQNYLYRETNIDNSCSIYSWGRHLGLSSLTEKTLDFIVDSADDVLKTEGFLKLSNDDLHSLLSREDICAFEEEIITAAIKWARNKCKQDMIETNGQTMRQALGPVIYTLRIPLLSLKRYSDIVVKSMILSEEEELSLYKYFTMSKKRLADLCGFDKSSRNRLSLFVKAEDIIKKRKVENIDDTIKATRFLQTSKSTIFVDTYTNKYQKQYNYQRTDYSQKISFFSPESFFINAITISFPFLSEKNKTVPEEIQISGSVPTRKIRIPVNETKLFDMNRYVKENDEIEIYFTSFSKFDKQFKENESSGWREVKIGSNKSVFVQVEGSYSIVSAIDISAAKMK